jgi:hypothetical protein
MAILRESLIPKWTIFIQVALLVPFTAEFKDSSANIKNNFSNNFNMLYHIYLACLIGRKIAFLMKVTESTDHEGLILPDWKPCIGPGLTL